MENIENRVRIMENALAEVQNSIDVSLAKVFNEIKMNPKKTAKKVAKVAIDSFEGLKELFPTEANRLIAWGYILKAKLIKWGVPSGLIFAGYVLQLLLS